MKALIFDLDDTLMVDEVSANTAFLKTCLYAQICYGKNLPGFQATIRRVCRSYWHESPAREYCIRVGISSWEGLWASFAGEDEDLQILRQWAPTYRKSSWLTTLKQFRIDDQALATSLAQRYIQARQELQIVYHDVEPVLQDLRNHYRLGLITNGAPDLQWMKIKAGRLDEFFDVIVVAGDFGIGKPDRRIFERALSLLGVGGESAMMVGDNLKSDVEGAQAVGMRTAWLNRQDEPRDNYIMPDCEIKNLFDLRQALEKAGAPYSR